MMKPFTSRLLWCTCLELIQILSIVVDGGGAVMHHPIPCHHPGARPDLGTWVNLGFYWFLGFFSHIGHGAGELEVAGGVGGHPNLDGARPLAHHLVQPHLPRCWVLFLHITAPTSNISLGRMGLLVSTTPKLKSSAALGLVKLLL